MDWTELPKDLEDSVDHMFSIAKVPFREINFEKIDGIAICLERFRVWDELNVYSDLMRLSKSTFIPLNPSREGSLHRHTILSRNNLEISRVNRTKHPSFFKSLRGEKPRRYREFTFEEYKTPEGKILSEFTDDSLIMPVYEGNPPFKKIMEYVKGER